MAPDKGSENMLEPLTHLKIPLVEPLMYLAIPVLGPLDYLETLDPEQMMHSQIQRLQDYLKLMQNYT